MNGLGLGDYISSLPNRVLSTKGAGMETGMPGDEQSGPVNSPITEADEGCPPAVPATDSVPELLRSMHGALNAICAKLGQNNYFQEYNNDMLQQAAARAAQKPDDAISFVATPANGTVNVPPDATAGDNGTVIAEITVPERCNGFLEWIGPTVDPVSAADQVKWQVRCDDTTHPGLNGNLPVNAMKAHIPFFWKVPPGAKLQVVAVNTGALPVNASAIFGGYFEPIKGDVNSSIGGFAS